jgi:hypothetical protein
VMRPFCWQGALLIWDRNWNGAFRIPPPTALTFWLNSGCNGTWPHDLGIIPLHLRAKVQNRNRSLVPQSGTQTFGNLTMIIP